MAGGGTGRAELYDPATGTWSVTGSMHVARSGQTATLLTDGQVLVAGGANSSAELYNPATGTWTLTGSMHTGRAGQTATLLNNGEVLVAGGTATSSTTFSALSSAELYNPATGSWTVTGSMTAVRDLQTATLLTSGQVLAVGGYNANASPVSSAELYNPATGKWTPTGAMSTPAKARTPPCSRAATCS